MGNRNPAPDQEGSNLVLGRNAVAELLQGGRETECIYICDNGKGGPVGRIIEMARAQGTQSNGSQQKNWKPFPAACPTRG